MTSIFGHTEMRKCKGSLFAFVYVYVLNFILFTFFVMIQNMTKTKKKIKRRKKVANFSFGYRLLLCMMFHLYNRKHFGLLTLSVNAEFLLHLSSLNWSFLFLLRFCFRPEWRMKEINLMCDHFRWFSTHNKKKSESCQNAFQWIPLNFGVLLFWYFYRSVWKLLEFFFCYFNEKNRITFFNLFFTFISSFFYVL